MRKFLKWNNLRLGIILLLTGFIFAFSNHRNDKRALETAKVFFRGENPLLVTHEMVNKLLIENHQHSTNVSKLEIDLNRLERNVAAHPIIEKAEIFVSIDGQMTALVEQKVPMARVLENQGHYYLDVKGEPMPLSSHYTVRVPLISGEVSDRRLKELMPLLQYIHHDLFLKQNIVGVHIRPDGQLELRNRGLDAVIVFGRPDHIERKFSNYKAFMQKAFADNIMDHYAVVNLKFLQQVVCTKK